MLIRAPGSISPASVEANQTRPMRRAVTTALVGTVLAATACGGTAEAFTPPSAAATATSQDVGLVPGESMSFEVRLGGVLLGEAALAVGQLGDFNGRRAITVHSKIGTTGAARLLRPIDDEATTIIDMDTGTPIRLDTHVLMSGQETTTTAIFSAGQVVVDVRRVGAASVQPFTFAFGKLPTHDAHSAMADLRGWRPEVGASRTVWLVGGRRLWRVDLSYVGHASIATPDGNRDADRLDGTAYRVHPDQRIDDSRAPRRFSVWISTDADRVPLRVTAGMELGDVEITLAEYQRP
jgi:hypothetical protein